ncbi:hypothetical protein MTO96_041782 [Rhipicephalus appendiculatus]
MPSRGIFIGRNASETLRNSPEDLPIGGRTMSVAFPLHVLFGRDFGVMQAGDGLLRLAGHRWNETRAQGEHGIKFNIFEISRLVIDCTFESIRTYCNQFSCCYRVVVTLLVVLHCCYREAVGKHAVVERC